MEALIAEALERSGYLQPNSAVDYRDIMSDDASF